MIFNSDLDNYFRNFMKGYQLEKTNPGLLDSLMKGVTIKRVGTHGLKDGMEYRKKIKSLQRQIENTTYRITDG